MKYFALSELGDHYKDEVGTEGVRVGRSGNSRRD